MDGGEATEADGITELTVQKGNLLLQFLTQLVFGLICLCPGGLSGQLDVLAFAGKRLLGGTAAH